MIKQNEAFKWFKVPDKKSEVPFTKAKVIDVKEKTFMVQIKDNETI